MKTLVVTIALMSVGNAFAVGTGQDEGQTLTPVQVSARLPVFSWELV